MDSGFKIYKRRWIMLLIFCMVSALNAAHWVQFSIITNVVIKYYGVSAMFVNWSAIVYSVVYVPCVFLTTWVIEKKGLKMALLISTGLMVIGSWCKLLSLNRNMFVVAFVCQVLLAIAQTFIISAPARLAGLWFPSKQVGTVCALGVLGNLFGCAVSLLLPPVVVKMSNDAGNIRSDFTILHIGMAIPISLLLFAVLFVFQREPPLPPNRAQHTIRRRSLEISYMTSLSMLMRNKDFVLLIIAFGLNVGVFYAYSTLLNQLFLLHYPKGEVHAGRIGMSLMVGGMLGTLGLGLILDFTQRYKEITMATFIMSTIGMAGFTFSLHFEYLYLIYMSSTFLGFFMTGYLAVAYEYAVELTFPLSESTSGGVMNSAGEALAMIFVSVCGIVVDNYGDLFTNLLLTVPLLVAFFLACFIKGHNLHRQNADRRSMISSSAFLSHTHVLESNK